MRATVKRVPNHEKRRHRWVKNVQGSVLDAYPVGGQECTLQQDMIQTSNTALSMPMSIFLDKARCRVQKSVRRWN